MGSTELLSSEELPTNEDEPTNLADFHAMEELSETAEMTDLAYGMSPEDFSKLKVAERDTILFALLRELTASQRALEMKIAEYEQKAREMMSPAGVEEMKKRFFDALGMGGGNGMFGGLF
jgi:hypothetical protein